jgi:hypothetical protein
MSDAATIIAISGELQSGSLTPGLLMKILKGEYIEKLSLL